MLRSFTLLLCAGILLLQGCSSSKMTEPLPPERQSTESIGISAEQELTNSQEDPQVLNAQSTITQSQPEEKQNISEQEKPTIKLSEGINQTEQVETASTATIGQNEGTPKPETVNLDQQPTQPEQTTASVIQIEDPWARAVPPNAKNSAIFLDLRNESEQLRKLVEVHSEVAERVELHMTKDEDGMLRKERLQEVLIPALETQSFHPGGIHIMLIGLRDPLEVGRVIELELVYADQSKETISVPVDERPLLPITAQNNYSPDSLTTRTQ